MFHAIDTRLTGLRARYAEPHRDYHGQAHVDTMLAGLWALGKAVLHGAAVELAIWYHDAIYHPAATDNEARSAALLRVEMDGLADPALLDQAELLVHATANHALPADLPVALKPDAALFLDLDMAVLGTDRAAFAAYERGIAAEYVPVHGLLPFRTGRACFLRAMLERRRVFLTDRFHLAYDAAARRNMEKALCRLEGEPAQQ
ncbi:MAG: HD domain-containing protein [Janthinobacterium lividum]